MDMDTVTWTRHSVTYKIKMTHVSHRHVQHDRLHDRNKSSLLGMTYLDPSPWFLCKNLLKPEHIRMREREKERELYGN